MAVKQTLIELRASNVAAENLSGVVLELVPARTRTVALALVVDASDSFGDIHRLLDWCPKLLRALPPDWPVWLYRLSDPSPLTDGTTTAHLVDQSVDLTRLLNDHRFVADSSGRGSFLRPVVDAISKRLQSSAVSEAWILVLTDGLLSDFSRPLGTRPTGIRVAAVTAKPDVTARRRWGTIMSPDPIFGMADAALDAWLGLRHLPISGLCSVTVDVPATCSTWRLEVGSRLTEVQGALRWDTRTGPLALIVEGSQTEQGSISVEQAFGPRVTLPIRNAQKSISADLMQAAVFARSNQPSRGIPVLIDLSEGNDRFDIAWAAIERASELARNFKPIPRELAALLQGSARTLAADEAALILSRGGSQRRVVLIALRRQVPLVWNIGQTLPFGIASEQFMLRYDRLESRWTRQSDSGAPVQLNPQGAERLPDLRFQGDSSPWEVLFSGPVS